MNVDLSYVELDAIPVAPWLSPDEWSRAARYRYPLDRARFVRRRVHLRRILAERLSVPPEAVPLRVTASGRPELDGVVDVDFNVSSSCGLAVYALSTGEPVGVDIERVVVREDLPDVAGRFFSLAERAALGLHWSTDAFYASWTLKEAFVKARGDGLLLPLEDFDVDPFAVDRSALMATRWDPTEAARWDVRRVDSPAGEAVAVAMAVARPSCACCSS
jgi:4'-phosphopantetheinyl transferase